MEGGKGGDNRAPQPEAGISLRAGLSNARTTMIRYWLALLYVAFPLGTPCEARISGQHDSYRYYHPRQASADGVWTQLGWPALPKLKKPSYSTTSRLYPRWPRPAAIGTHDRRVLWPNTWPAVPAAQSHIHQPQTDPRNTALARPYQSMTPQVPSHGSVSRHKPLPASSTNSGTLAYPLPVRHPEEPARRAGNQWLWPRKFLTSSDTGRGSSQARPRPRGEQQSCENGKVWHQGRCECPYLSNWNASTNKCECIYGTYRHSSGHCHSY